MWKAMVLPSCRGRCARWLASLALVAVLEGCDPPRRGERVVKPRVAVQEDLTYLQRQEVGRTWDIPPWIAHATTVDLDQDGRLDIIACESQDNQVLWLRQMAPDRFEEIVVAADVQAPVHVEAADMDADGDLDLLVSLMGYVFPNNDRIGTVLILENDGRQKFTHHPVLEKTARVTDIRAADFNGDGRMDLAVAQFGYDQGEVRWMKRTGPWEFESHILVDLSGAINVCVDDFNGDNRPDIVALISQQWEEVYYFENKGADIFGKSRIWGSTNEDYGSSGISVCDLNRDGRPDVLYTNGDGFGPAALPGPRPWHGVQWLENIGEGYFRYHRIGDLPGAYSPVGVDLDNDGATDVVAVSAYSDMDNRNPRVVSLMWFQNDGRMGFRPRALARSPKDLITLATGDFDGDGQQELVTGGFYVHPHPPRANMSRLAIWRR